MSTPNTLREMEMETGSPRPSRLGEVWGSVIALPQPKTETIFVHFVLSRKTTFSDRILVNVANLSTTELLKWRYNK